ESHESNIAAQQYNKMCPLLLTITLGEQWEAITGARGAVCGDGALLSGTSKVIPRSLFFSQTSFHRNLHLVLVLRPTSLLQQRSPGGTTTDIGFRFSQEDFALKMPVIMLSSVTDLLRYIDENQLSSEYGGTLECCSSDWIVLRTAIESFAVTVKEIAQLLQTFGTELSETELPDEASGIEYLLRSHTDKYRQMKVRLPVVLMMKEGRNLLTSLEASKAPEGATAEDRDGRQDRDTVQRLLTQLRDMEMAFDGFFEKHHLKLQQYLQLLRYEQNFHEVRRGRKKILSFGGITSEYVYNLAVITLLVINHRFLGLVSYHKYTKHHIFMNCLSCLFVQALHWCDQGAYLLAGQLVDKFQSKEGAQAALRDIEKLEEGAPSVIRSSADVLILEFQAILTPQLQVQTHTQTYRQTTSIRGMIQSRQACLRKLADVQVRPIQLVAPRPENPPRCRSPMFSPKHSMGELTAFLSTIHVTKELIDTERIYVEELLSVLLGYRAEMDNPALSGLLPDVLRSKKDDLFGNMAEIYGFHSRIFLQDLESCLETPNRVGACFLERKESFKVYECYCQNKPRSEALWRQCSDSPFFQECQKKLEHKLGLDSYLLKPVQRLTKYQLLLKELLKHSGDSDCTSELQGALNAMLDLLKFVNDSMHQIAITGYEGELSDLGRVLMQGSFNVWISHKKGATRMKDLARFKPMQRHLFLHERALLFCKKREENGEGHDRTASYSFKHCLRMSAVGITENVKADVKKFEIWYSGREEVYLIQAPSVEVKMAWLTEIRKILTNQQRVVQGSYLESHCLSSFILGVFSVVCSA
uniref:MCF.2 cell line derived transforming sequence b n=1 Tax=Denticeps clupeoides TaxID=299321 RepID=A0AAY4AZL6_9TELE